MNKIYVRVDDRLIHGQIVTSWVKSLNIRRIIAIDDIIAGNEMMKSIVTMGVPSHIESLIIKKSELGEFLKDEKDTLIIVRFSRDLDTLFDELKTAVHINIGNCSKQTNPVLTTKGKGVGQLLSFTQEDVDTLNRFNNFGTEVIIQQLPTDKITTWNNIKI